MLYILHQPKDLEELEKNIIPLLEEKENQLVSFPPEAGFQPGPEDIALIYLNDQDLKEFLPFAIKENWKYAILPHPGAAMAIKGFGLSDKAEAVISQLKTEKPVSLDLLKCNGRPVFQSVNIGNVFILTEDQSGKNFFAEAFFFIKNIRRISNLSHLSFILSADGEKLIKTSALGIIVVEHPSGSVISNRLVPESAINDGMFNVVLLSPENLLVLFWFLFKSLLPGSKPLKSFPKFIGHIKTSNLIIENEGNMEFTVDGEKFTAEKIELEVQKEAVCLQQESKNIAEETKSDGKKSLKTETLPTGEKREELTQRKLPWLPRATTEEFQELFTVLRENAKLSTAFLVMMILSTLIATFGLYGDSSPVIIGAMILAPIISPIVSFSMGMVRYDVNMLKTGVATILIGTVVSLAFSAGVSVIIPLRILTSEIDARLSPTLLDMGIAVASGIAAAYAHAKEGIAKSLAGVAIAVALVPPLAVAGIGIGWWDWQIFSGAILLYFTNLAGIIMFAGITFLLLGFAPFKRARMGLVYTFLIILLVMVPLSLSFNRIMQEAQITKELEGTSVNESVLKDVKVRFGTPMVVSLKLVSSETIEASEMQNIKKQIEERIGRPVILEVVSAVEF
ncbi:TIGR00341 family protein [Salegentibacter chungangensis]|uniref:TIGR00341 family protein n=1 Tax=Salegentibacter chungangensis TaxID=1335724 RepID=A0ABW3NSI2_9FLAO